jgi:hypothetical protein
VDGKPDSLGEVEELVRLPLPVPLPPSPALEAELAQLSPIAPRRPLRQLAILFAVSLAYGAGILAVLTLRGDLYELPIGWILGAGLAWLLGFVVPMYLATVPRAGAVIPRWQFAGIASLIGAVGFVALGLLVHPSGPHSTPLDWDQFGPTGCFEFGLATALVPVVIGAMFLRGALPVGSRYAAAALGAGGGSLGGLMLHLHCPIAGGLHVGVMHGGVVGVAALVAAAMVPRATHVR